ncbi:MAG: phosphate ABC transporter substrate-binding/OmpA family protein [Methyloligellaceae bacterium]
MTTNWRKLCLCLAAALFVTMLPSFAAFANNEEVSLKLKKGSLVFTGALIGYNERSFVLRTSQYGHITLDATKFDCITPNCGTLLQVYLVRAKNEVKKRRRPEHKISFIGKASPDFSVHGSNTIGSRLMPALVKGFAKRNGYQVVEKGEGKEIKLILKRHNGEVLTTIDLQRHGSSTAFPALEKGKAILGMSDRRIKKDEIAKLAATGAPGMSSSDKEHVIGVDGILVIVSPKNTITSLTKKQMARIFSGEVKNWSEVGGPPGKINVYAPDSKSGTFSTFRSLVLKPNKLKLIKSAQRYASNSELSDKVSSDANSIGITGFAYKGRSKPIAIASSCGIMHGPSQFNVSTDEYPLSRRLYLYTNKKVQNKYARALLAFSKDASSTEGILKQKGFIGRSIGIQPFHEQGQRMSAIFTSPTAHVDMKLLKQFSKDLHKGSRLSFTVRFQPNSSLFDSESLQLFGQLGRFIVTNKMEKNYFILAGFSDSRGHFEKNLVLSKSRAMQVAQKLREATRGFIDPSRVLVKAYGELLPVACNDTPAGRARNRRVEIWTVKPEHWPIQPVQRSTIDNKITLNLPSAKVPTE